MMQSLIDALGAVYGPGSNPVAQLIVIIGIATVAAIDCVRLPACDARPEPSDGPAPTARTALPQSDTADSEYRATYASARYGVGDVGSKVFT